VTFEHRRVARAHGDAAYGVGGPWCPRLALVRATPGGAHMVVSVYAAQRKPVASGRGASGLAGSSPGGLSSL
jgi:hypothetical protein